jgi:hypothetical protein
MELNVSMRRHKMATLPFPDGDQTVTVTRLRSPACTCSAGAYGGDTERSSKSTAEPTHSADPNEQPRHSEADMQVKYVVGRDVHAVALLHLLQPAHQEPHTVTSAGPQMQMTTPMNTAASHFCCACW